MRILIIGATDEAINITRNLIVKGHEVVVLDNDRDRIDRVVQELDVAAYLFSITDLSAFMQAGIHRADMVLAIHPVDTVNILACVYAKHFNVPRILAVVGSQQTANVLERLGLAHNVLVKSKAVANMLMELLYNSKLIEIDEDHYIAMTEVSEGSRINGRSVEELEDNGVKVLAVISRENTVANIDKAYRMKVGDRVLIMVRKDRIDHVLFGY